MKAEWIKQNSEYDENGEKDWGTSTDYIMNGCLTESTLLMQFLGRRDKYGEMKYHRISANAYRTESLIDSIGGDKVLGTGIYIGTEIASPAYEKMGEEFLKEMILGYNKADYAEILMRGVLKGMRTPKTNIICRGIRDIIEKGDSDIPEAKVGVIVKEISTAADVVSDSSWGVSLYGIGIDETKKKIKETGVIRTYGMDKLEKFRKSLIEDFETTMKPLVPNNPNGKENLFFLYEHFMKNYDQIDDEDFLYMFSNLSKSDLAAYYVATRPETGIEEVIKKIKNGR